MENLPREADAGVPRVKFPLGLTRAALLRINPHVSLPPYLLSPPCSNKREYSLATAYIANENASARMNDKRGIL